MPKSNNQDIKYLQIQVVNLKNAIIKKNRKRFLIHSAPRLPFMRQNLDIDFTNFVVMRYSEERSCHLDMTASI